MLDSDGDGAISSAELQDVFASQATTHSDASFWKDVMAQVDTNNDGFISYEEFQQHMFDVVNKRATFYNPEK